MINTTIIQNAAKALLAKVQCFKSFQFTSKPVLLVLTVGKVGSAAVYETIKSQCRGVEVYHFHFLSDRLRQVKREYLLTANGRVPFHIYIGEEVVKYLPHIMTSSRQLYVVTLIRDPVAFVLSDVFQNPEFTTDDSITVVDSNKDRLASLVRERVLTMAYLPYIRNWFDSEIRDHFGIDVFSVDFDKKNGYQVFRKGAISLLLIRLEDLTRNGVQAITEFLPSESSMTLKKKNIRGEGGDANVYSYVRSKLNLDRDALMRIYSNPLVDHFYSKEDVLRFIQRWSGVK